MDARERFVGLIHNIGIDKAIKEMFNIKCKYYVNNPDNEQEHFKSLKKYAPFIILVSGGIKEEGQKFPFKFSDEKTAFRDFYYYDLWNFLNNSKKTNKKNLKLIWRKRPEYKLKNENEGYIYSRFTLIN